ncbi:hypothetical protein [Halococcus sp. IIIV-5B]|uniref:hypothetical protein n=1 Tax=Halococcus sp. IIIV-5B TaxID=2321230 RepID=UPI0011C44940|nr:hypothetical protein [Halococcus sp. IIIV-5B]
MAADINYSHAYTRKGLKGLLRRGFINGQKTTPIIGCSVNGQIVVLTSDYQGMIDVLRRISPPLAAKARAATVTVQQLHDFIKNHAQGTFILERRWLFWHPSAVPSSGTPSSASASP